MPSYLVSHITRHGRKGRAKVSDRSVRATKKGLLSLRLRGATPAVSIDSGPRSIQP